MFDINKDLYCRLYINSTNDEEEELRNTIANLFGGEVYLKRIRDNYLDIHFGKNDSFNEQLFSDSIYGCVYSRFTAEVGPIHDNFETVNTEIYIDILCHIIKNLRSMGYSVVAACDYEDVIAGRTGYEPG